MPGPTPGERQAQGFRNRRTYLLEWPEDSEYHGLLVRVRPTTLGVMVELDELEDEADRPLIDIFRPLADVLLWWNLLDDNDEPVPPTLDAMLGQDSRMMGEIIRAWQQATMGVSAPKGQKSTDGERSVEASLTMEPLSESHAI